MGKRARRRFSGERRAAALAILLATAVVWGCAEPVPRIDPSGQRLFAPPDPGEPYPPRELPARQTSCDPVELLLTPRTTVAPVGSEVVLVAGVRGADRYLRTNERVEWTMAPGGVGEFVELDRHYFPDLLLGDFTWPRKVSATQVITSTSRQYLRLTRGTPTPADDVIVHRGQTWVTVTSPVEGTSYVTAFAPAVYGWDRHKQTAMIHWLDAQWQFPPPAINAVGTRHVFTTMVMRQSDQSPRAGWVVRYTISGGPPAAFAATGGPTVDVQTDATGRANAEIYQPQPTCGTNAIGILVIRPAGSGGLTGPLVVGSGGTSKTWSAPGLALRMSGPAIASARRHRHVSLGAVEPRRSARGGHCRDRRNSRGIFLPYQQACGRGRRAHHPLAGPKARPRPVLFHGIRSAGRSDRERHQLCRSDRRRRIAFAGVRHDDRIGLSTRWAGNRFGNHGRAQTGATAGRPVHSIANTRGSGSHTAGAGGKGHRA